MNRRHLLLFAGALAALAAVETALPPRALLAAPDDGGKKGKGKDKDKDDKEKEREEQRKSAEGREAVAVAGEFAAKASSSLKARIRPKGKLTLNLGAKNGDYAEDQAPQILDEWFGDKKDLKAEFSGLDGLTATFKLTFGTKGSDKAQEKRLLVTIEKKTEGEGFWLAKLELV